MYRAHSRAYTIEKHIHKTEKNVSKDHCKHINMRIYDLGYSHALRGWRVKIFNRTVNKCASYGISLNRSVYYKGWKSGVYVFCTYKRGYRFGLYGGQYLKICSKGNESDFLRGYYLGVQKYKRKEWKLSLKERQMQWEKELFEIERQAYYERKRLERKKRIRRERELSKREKKSRRTQRRLRAKEERQRREREKRLEKDRQTQLKKERTRKEKEKRERETRIEKERFAREQKRMKEERENREKEEREREARIEEERFAREQRRIEEDRKRREKEERERQARIEEERFLREQRNKRLDQGDGARSTTVKPRSSETNSSAWDDLIL